jgi:hypothetical protein
VRNIVEERAEARAATESDADGLRAIVVAAQARDLAAHEALVVRFRDLAVGYAYDPCPALSDAALYHVGRGNVGFALQLEQIGYGYFCGAFIVIAWAARDGRVLPLAH